MECLRAPEKTTQAKLGVVFGAGESHHAVDQVYS